MFEGTFAAIATPFEKGRLDQKALLRLARFLVESGVDGLVACGTTGEAPTLTMEEWERVVGICVEQCGTLPVIAGTGTNSTAATVERTIRAGELGARGALVVTPYYNKPTQAGLLAHYREVARRTGFPIVLYNVPSRTGINMTPETVAELSREEHIVGIKDASGSTGQFAALIQRAAGGFKVLSGDDSLCFPLYALGGHGAISTTATAAPAQMSLMFRQFKQGNIEEARRHHYELLPLFAALFAETNPAPLKYALSVMGMVRNELRLPLVAVGAETEGLVRAALASCGIISG